MVTVRGTVRVLAELLLTAGLLLLLFLAYHLWWTGVVADRMADDTRDDLIHAWDAAPTRSAIPGDRSDADGTAAPGAGGAGAGTPAAVVSADPGEAFALAYIPRLRRQVWGLPVIHGVDKASLARGLGWYPGTAGPGDRGNFALAGHRATHGEPLRGVDTLRVGDLVVVRTKEAWFTYSLERDALVRPADTWVVDPVPFRRDGQLLGRRITLITCHPRWSSDQRWIWWGSLIDVRPAADGPPAAVRGT